MHHHLLLVTSPTRVDDGPYTAHTLADLLTSGDDSPREKIVPVCSDPC